MGRLLDLLSEDCIRGGEPSLAAIVVNSTTGEVGIAFGDPIRERALLYAQPNWGQLTKPELTHMPLQGQHGAFRTGWCSRALPLYRAGGFRCQTAAMSDTPPEPEEAPDTTWVETEEIRKDYGSGEPTDDNLQKRAEHE